MNNDQELYIISLGTSPNKYIERVCTDIEAAKEIATVYGGRVLKFHIDNDTSSIKNRKIYIVYNQNNQSVEYGLVNEFDDDKVEVKDSYVGNILTCVIPVSSEEGKQFLHNNLKERTIQKIVNSRLEKLLTEK